MRNLSGLNTQEAARLVDRDLFRDVVGRFASGVTVVTARDQGTDYGMTASAIASLSMDPPMLLVCLKQMIPTQGAVSRSRALAVNILGEDQGEVAAQFARPHENKFRGTNVSYGVLGEPLLVDALAHLECRVVEEVCGGTHSVFLAEVQSADAREGTPLAYFRGKFGRFEEASDEEVYRRIREWVLRRDIQIGQPLNIDDLAYQFDTPRQAVYYALTKLTAEGLVSKGPEGGYVVTPIDAKASDDAFDARRVIELGVAEMTVGYLSAEELDGLRERLEIMKPLITDDRFVDFEDYLKANTEYHEYLIGLTGNEALLSSYRLLSLKGLMARAFGGSNESSDKVIEEHVRLTEAYEEENLQAAKTCIQEYADLAKQRARSVLEAAGGSV